MVQLGQRWSRFAIAVATVGALVACVAEENRVVVPTSSDAGGGDANGGDGGSGGDICDRYCAEVAANCTGANQQYRDLAECKLACALLDPGTEQDGEINTVGCRLRQARAASKQSCLAAGPFGGDVCGKHCDVFCRMVEKNCAAEPSPPYPSASTCIEQCPSFPVKDPSAISHTTHPSGDSFECRAHHAILSLSDKTNHCPHTAPISVTCNAGPHDAGADH